MRYPLMNPQDDKPPPASTPTPTSNGRLGGRDGLPPGSLPKPYLAPQGDENRDPPPNAPTPVEPAVTVATTRRNAAKPGPGQD
ncbi:hypothetical protein CCS01_03820 [Rhodopila globiformis]|uniref:Uncharacterized protein n=2 Tax=Rhodopila globiformis TaxID=1071 RepID=A0A2S6NMD8_RHOGL|nr:hypothetical protein CCS01_03820 [Rhodopila globiformis]